MKNALCVLLILVLVIGSLFVLELFGLQWRRFFEPKREDIKREVFENTKSYVHGVAQDLAKYRLEFLKTESKVEKDAIISTIRMRFANFDADKLENKTLRRFLLDVQNGKY